VRRRCGGRLCNINRNDRANLNLGLECTYRRRTCDKRLGVIGLGLKSFTDRVFLAGLSEWITHQLPAIIFRIAATSQWEASTEHRSVGILVCHS
jgi:hypothetical protein